VRNRMRLGQQNVTRDFMNHRLPTSRVRVFLPLD